MLACSFLSETSSKLLVTRTGIKARTSLIFGRISILTLVLLALEWREFSLFELEYLWGQDRHKSFWASGFHGPFICFFKCDLTLAHWTQVSDHCPLGYLFYVPPPPPPTKEEGPHIAFCCGFRLCLRSFLSALYLLNQCVDFDQTGTEKLEVH